MIYTLTLNPSIDYVAFVPEFKEGSMNSIENAHYYAGGKGINVSRVLHTLGVPSIAMGWIAGFTGDFIEQSLIQEGISVDFVHLPEDCSRINFKMKSTKETECNGKGPAVPNDALDLLVKKLDRLQDDDVLVLSGSIPSSIKINLYREIMERLNGRSIRIVLDARNELVLDCLDLHPWLLKPNLEELQEMFCVSIEDKEQIVCFAQRLRELGAGNVLVSLGEDGALLCAEDGHVYEQCAPDGELRNSTGAGDSMVAGYLYGLLQQGNNFAYALKMAVAAGSATAFEEDLADGKKIRALFEKIQTDLSANRKTILDK